MRLRVKFNKVNYLKYIGHLDLMRLFQRSLNLAQVPVKYTKGFNPTPRFAIANPLSLGIEGEEEYMDIELEEKIDRATFKEKMNKILPPDVKILESHYIDNKDSIAALISYGLYEISFENIRGLDYESMEKLINDWMDQEEILITRLRKRKKRRIEVEENIRSLIKEMKLKSLGEKIILEAILKIGEGGNLRPFDFMVAFLRDNEILEVDKDSIGYKRKELYIDRAGNLEKPF